MVGHCPRQRTATPRSSPKSHQRAEPVYHLRWPTTLVAMAQISVDTGISFTCSSQEECKRKCEELGGRWKGTPDGATHGTCTLPPSSVGGGAWGLLTATNLLAVLVIASATILLGRFAFGESRSATRADNV